MLSANEPLFLTLSIHCCLHSQFRVEGLHFRVGHLPTALFNAKSNDKSDEQRAN